MEVGKWYALLLRPCEYKEQRGHNRPFKRRNYLRGSSELYKTKEALHDKLMMLLGGWYDTSVLEKAEPEYRALNKFDYQVRLTAAKTAMIRRYLEKIERAPSFLGPFVDASCHDESQRCDACPESVSVPRSGEGLQGDLQSMSSGSSDGDPRTINSLKRASESAQDSLEPPPKRHKK